jgi:hypothetical protein
MVCIHDQKNHYWVCRRCQDEGARIVKKIEKAVKDGRTNITMDVMKYSYENTGLKFRWPGDDPLQDLTLVEESMISLVSAVTTVQQITGMILCNVESTHAADGHKSFGNTSFFVNWKSVKDVATLLPRNVHEARVMFRYPVRNTGGKALMEGRTSMRTSEFKVDAEKLRIALGWLIEEHNNPLYGHVGIDEVTLESLKTSRKNATGRSIQEALDEFEELDARYCSALNMDPVQSSQIPAILRDQYGGAQGQTVQLERNGDPVLPHRTDKLLAQCFPTLFPDGGGNYRHFSVPLSTAEMLAHTVKFADPRFSQHYRYIFMMVNMKNLDMAFRGIAPALKGRILKSKLDGTVVDMTEEMFEKFARVVCENICKFKICNY